MWEVISREDTTIRGEVRCRGSNEVVWEVDSCLVRTAYAFPIPRGLSLAAGSSVTTEASRYVRAQGLIIPCFASVSVFISLLRLFPLKILFVFSVKKGSVCTVMYSKTETGKSGANTRRGYLKQTIFFFSWKNQSLFVFIKAFRKP